jgi:hypothetical protein
LKEYKNGTYSIKELAQRANYPPALLARFVVEAVLMNSSSSNSDSNSETKRSPSSTMITDAMRNPAKILSSLDNIAPEFHAAEQFGKKPDLTTSGRNTMAALTVTTTRLAREVMEAIDSDPLHGPLHERERHFVGVEYEVVLEYQLKSLSKCVSLCVFNSSLADFFWVVLCPGSSRSCLPFSQVRFTF